MVSFTLGREWEEGVAAIQEGKKKLAAIVMNLVEAKCGKACQFGISGSPRHKQIWHSHACFFPGGGGVPPGAHKEDWGKELTGCLKDKHETRARPHNLLS